MTLHEFLSKSNRPTGVTLTISPYRPSASTLVLRRGEVPLYIYRVGPPTVGRFKSTRRLRWPIGRRTPDGLIGSVVTRTQVMNGGLDEEQTRALQMNFSEREKRLMGMRIVDSANELWGGRLPYNPRQGWAPSGERIL